MDGENTEARVILDAGGALAEPLYESDHEIIARVGTGGHQRLERIALEAPRPAAKTGVVKLHDVKSLIAYTLRHRTADTVIYADQEHERITAVLDDHGEKPGHGRHRAVYPCPVTTEWQAWKAVLGKALSQEQLVDFFEERALDVAEPPAAELQEMIRELVIKKDVAWKKAFDERTGKVTLEFKEDVTESAGRSGSVQLPSHFVIGVSVYSGGDPYRCEVRLRYRLAEAKLRLFLSIDNVERIEEVAFGEAAAEVEAGLSESLVLRGEAPGERRPG